MSTESYSSIPPREDYVASAAWGDSVSKIVYYLDKFPAQIEMPSAGRTPLLWAISAGRPEVAQMFIKKGADITRTTAEGDTALACAVWSGLPEMVRFVLSKDIDPLVTGSNGITPLVWARLGKQPEIIKLLEDAARAALAAAQRKNDAEVSRSQDQLSDIARRRKKAVLKP